MFRIVVVVVLIFKVYCFGFIFLMKLWYSLFCCQDIGFVGDCNVGCILYIDMQSFICDRKGLFEIICDGYVIWLKLKVGKFVLFLFDIFF